MGTPGATLPQDFCVTRLYCDAPDCDAPANLLLDAGYGNIATVSDQDSDFGNYNNDGEADCESPELSFGR
jgi:hypothetical protein